MDLNTFQNHALRTWNGEEDRKHRITVSALGLAGESGEFADLIKKWLGHGHALDTVECKKELGDILYYIAVASFELGFSLSQIAEGNVEKLKQRYPDGFSEEISKNRYK